MNGIIKRGDYNVDSLGRKFKSPVEERVKKSKFAKILSEMTDEDIKALGYCILVSDKVRTAIKYLHHTVEPSVSFYALETEYKKRIKGKK
jgi:hypothetical protein